MAPERFTEIKGERVTDEVQVDHRLQWKKMTFCERKK